ncbi:MAG: histidinol-phosphate transaminase [Alphaproteobacteria bacterium]|nr:histidinol-phosphate transaminase [Alphaproteobacteria bacterium]
MSPLRPRPGILEITTYVGGEAEAPGASRVIKLSSNESALGVSPKVVDALREQGSAVFRYPDGGADQLRRALAQHHGLAAERLLCGAGSDELLTLLVRAYAGPGDEVLYSWHGFLMYPITALSVGAVPVAAAETNYTADVDRLLALVTSRTKLVMLANPNNPTGSYVGADAMRRLRAALPADVLLVIDAAYAEYVSRNDYSPGTDLVDANDNVVMTRTFSKIYGLAGLRLGWCYGPPDVIDVLQRIRGPFNVSAAAQVAGLAALQDADFLQRARAHNERWLPWLTDQYRGLGLRPLPSVANFVLVGFGAAARAKAAGEALKGAGILVRGMAAYGLPDFLRITVGLEEENRVVIETLRVFVARHPG